ncbi:MAG TPA: hypothetical protein VLB75_10460 [Steroidobacteraceae bacterium]|nr:hypothetical protein [Steroidobacteraceae bacterium]
MKRVLCVLGLGLVAGCGQDNSSREPEPMPVEDTVFADQVKAMQRAEDRAKEMEGRMQDLNKALESAEGTPSPEPEPEQ